jgi:hypothetical protein
MVLANLKPLVASSRSDKISLKPKWSAKPLSSELRTLAYTPGGTGFGFHPISGYLHFWGPPWYKGNPVMQNHPGIFHVVIDLHSKMPQYLPNQMGRDAASPIIPTHRSRAYEFNPNFETATLARFIDSDPRAGQTEGQQV